MNEKTIKIENIMGLSNNAYKEIVARKQVLDIKDVKDPLSLLISTTVLGSDIGITIIRGSNVLMIKKDLIFEDGKMTEIGLALLHKMLVPLQELVNIKNIDSIKELHGKRIKTIYDSKNCATMTNRFGMVRQLKRISEAEIQAAVDQIKSFGIETTEEEFDTFVNDFVNIVRALGESSIDVKKHRDRHYSRDIHGFVGKGSACIGNMKSGRDPKKALTANLYLNSGAVMRTGEGYQMFLPEELEDAFEDAIGDVKLAVKDSLEDCVNGELAKVHSFDYNNYYKRLSNLHDLYPETRRVISYASSLVRGRKFTQPDEEEPDKYTDKFLAVLRNCIFGVAKLEGMKMKDVYSLAIEICFLDNKGFYYKDANLKCVEVNKMLTAVDKIFGDIAVFEYADNKLDVPLTVTDKPSDYADGNVYILEDGASEDFELCVEENFTGEATVVDGQLIASYDPYVQVDDNYVAIPIDNFFPVTQNERKEGKLVKNKKGAINALRNSDVTRVKVSADGVSKIYVPVVIDGATKAKSVGFNNTTLFNGLKLKTVDLLCFEKEEYVDLAKYLYVARTR